MSSIVPSRLFACLHPRSGRKMFEPFYHEVTRAEKECLGEPKEDLITLRRERLLRGSKSFYCAKKS
jgi:hypothetical protein